MDFDKIERLICGAVIILGILTLVAQVLHYWR